MGNKDNKEGQRRPHGHLKTRQRFFGKRKSLRRNFERASQELHRVQSNDNNGFFDPNYGKSRATELAKAEPRQWQPAIFFWEDAVHNARRELAVYQGAVLNNDPYDIVATIESDDEAIMEVIYDVSEDDREGGAVVGGDAAVVTPDNAAAADVTDTATASTDNAAAVAATAITPDTEGGGCRGRGCYN